MGKLLFFHLTSLTRGVSSVATFVDNISIRSCCGTKVNWLQSSILLLYRCTIKLNPVSWQLVIYHRNSVAAIIDNICYRKNKMRKTEKIIYKTNRIIHLFFVQDSLYDRILPLGRNCLVIVVFRTAISNHSHHWM